MSNPTEGKAIREMTLGLHVTKTKATLADGNLFTIYGRVLVTLLWGQATAVGDGGATTIKLQEETNSIDLCAATTITSDAIGTTYFLTGEVAVILNGTGNIPIIGVGANLTGFPSSPIIVGMAAALDAVQQGQTGDDTAREIEGHAHHNPPQGGAPMAGAGGG